MNDQQEPIEVEGEKNDATIYASKPPMLFNFYFNFKQQQTNKANGVWSPAFVKNIHGYIYEYTLMVEQGADERLQLANQMDHNDEILVAEGDVTCVVNADGVEEYSTYDSRGRVDNKYLKEELENYRRNLPKKTYPKGPPPVATMESAIGDQDDDLDDDDDED